jgi:transcription elongation factor S-II
MPPMLTTVLLTTKGEVRKANISLNDDGEITIDIVQQYFRKKDAPDELCRYTRNDRQFILFGYKKGKAGTENKHELPAPYTKHPRFGDILVFQIMTGDEWTDSSLPMTPEQWKEFVEGHGEDGIVEEEEEGEDEDEEEEDVEDDVEDDDLGDEGVDEDAPIADPDDDIEPEPQITRRRKLLTVNVKADPNTFKEEVDLTTPASHHVIRAGCFEQLLSLKDIFTEVQLVALESAIFRSAFDQAKKHFVPRNWKSLHFQELYKQTARQVLWNIHPKSPIKNERLLERINDSEFTIEALATMSAYDMYPEYWRELADKQLIREQKILEGNKSRATDQYKCRRCCKSECTYYEMQTRSADEPMTIFITCINCGKRWRQ